MTARQRMIEAPALPPVSGRRRSAAPPPAAVPSQSWQRGVAVLQAFADAHEQHVRSMAELHRRFLALQAGTALPQAPDAPAAIPVPAGRPGPKFTRPELEQLAMRKRSIASLFGPLFARQETHRHQIRIPAPPMMLTDRILGFEGEPGSLGSGRAWSETDLHPDAWGLDPAGYATLLVGGESAQVNMLLASWLGADLTHQGELRYRLLSLDVQVLGAFPHAGETVCQEVVLERQVVVGGRRLFFFTTELSVAGEPRVRAKFSAGLFGDADLANPEPVGWTAARDRRPLDGPFEVPAGLAARAFPPEAIAAWNQGRGAGCCGPGFERLSSHVRSPRAATAAMALLHAVPEFDPQGGPWKRGYLRAVQRLTADDWFFHAHFPGDPCMPGFVMIDAASQAAAFHLTALGATLRRDGWRFAPTAGETCSCTFRGQVTPQSAELVYELFVESLSLGPEPRLVADVLCSIGGRAILHCRRFAYGLVPDWPLDQFRQVPYRPEARGAAGPLAALGGLAGFVPETDAVTLDGARNDYAAMLALAWGRADAAFGRRVAAYAGPLRHPRLPAPPYLFLSRIVAVRAEAGKPQPGAAIESVYDIPPEAWYFAGSDGPWMPFAVLIEAALQPCGWLMFHLARNGDEVLGRHLRNLDGEVTVHRALAPDAGSLRVTTELTLAAEAGGVSLRGFRMTGVAGGAPVFEAVSTFGVFPPEALEAQQGLPAGEIEQARIEAPSAVAFVPAGLDPMLGMIDRVTALDPGGGAAGLGWIRGEKAVDPDAWFFKAHFFQDPVQPGSLGLEALLQLMRIFMVERGLVADLAQPCFEPVALGRRMSWKYRGQVIPESRRVVTEVEIEEIGRDARGVYAMGRGALWVDGVRVYQVSGLGMRAVAQGVPAP